jgi:hypothetical protein
VENEFAELKIRKRTDAANRCFIVIDVDGEEKGGRMKMGYFSGIELICCSMMAVKCRT